MKRRVLKFCKPFESTKVIKSVKSLKNIVLNSAPPHG